MVAQIKKIVMYKLKKMAGRTICQAQIQNLADPSKYDQCKQTAARGDVVCMAHHRLIERVLSCPGGLSRGVKVPVDAFNANTVKFPAFWLDAKASRNSPVDGYVDLQKYTDLQSVMFRILA